MALARPGFREVVINLSWLGEQIRAALGDGSRYGIEIHYSEEGPEPLETGGGIFRALPLLGDGPVPGGERRRLDRLPVCALARCACMPGDLAHLVLVPNPAHNASGRFRAARTAACVEGEAGDALHVLRHRRVPPGLFDGCRDGVFKLAPLLRAAAACGAGERRTLRRRRGSTSALRSGSPRSIGGCSVVSFAPSFSCYALRS